MAANLAKWPSNRGLISKIRPSDGCKGNTVPSTVVRGYGLRKPGGHLGNVGEYVWVYRGKPSNTFNSRHISGCQRLASGNTLICEGICGRIFEVTPQGDIVWNFVSPYFASDDLKGPGAGQNMVFRALRYAADSPEIAGRLNADPYA